MTTITEFWLQNPDYWITPPEKQQTVDKIIFDKFHAYDYNKEDILGQIIYLDQFIRHFSRVIPIEESTINKSRLDAANLTQSLTKCQLQSTTEAELVWYLMPLKHIQTYSPIFEIINHWLKNQSITQFPTLNRFFMDTYKKAYTVETVDKNIKKAAPCPEFYYTNICEHHPTAYTSPTWSLSKINPNTEELISAVKQFKHQQVAVSLSGGVDSMLLTALLKHLQVDVIAIHIVYGNRKESTDERNFIQTYCAKLQVPLYTYTIEWLKRSAVDRAFYESITRELRFFTYKVINRPVIMGHIQEDVIENIWTNLAHGTHLDNLAKFQPTSTESNITINRPWLHIQKSTIFQTAHAINIPYLKNTTPLWSNRGKFRNQFYQETHKQYGPSIDNTLLLVAERYKKQAQILDKLLYQTISDSWDPQAKQLNITPAVKITLDADGWLRIFTDLAHNKLNIKKPKYKACAEFEERVKKGLVNNSRINMKKDLCVRIHIGNENIYIIVL